jgi:protein-tyrosine phosphatase
MSWSASPVDHALLNDFVGRVAPLGYVDLHAHLIPGVDDGPADLTAAIAMGQAAIDAGIETLVATPHLRADFPAVRVEEIDQRCQALQDVLRSRGIDLQVVPGAEVSLVWALEASDDQLRLASIAHRGSDLLIETPNDISMIEQLLFQVRTRGYRITLAHPERSRDFQSHPEHLEALSENGILLEINAEALLLPRRSQRRRLAERMCRSGHAHALASDAHSADSARPISVLAGGREALVALVGTERADWMMSVAPRAIVAGGPVPDPPPTQSGARTRAKPAVADAAPAPTPVPFARQLARGLMLTAIAAIAVLSFILVRGQQGSGAQLAAQQSSSGVLNRAAVDRVLKAAPNGTTGRRAVSARCVPHGKGVLRNPWQCRLTYPGGQQIGWQVSILLSGAYLGYDQLVYGKGTAPRRSRGTITGCCIAVP